MSDLVTIVTATTGRPELKKCVESVRAQTHANVQHIIMVDGRENYGKTIIILDEFSNSMDNAIFLPYSVGENRYNGHLMYAAATYLAKGNYIMYLDDDNWIDPDHVSSLYKAITESSAPYAFSLRKIVSQSGEYICNDDCESLGPIYGTCLDINDHLIDVNCYFFQRQLAVLLTPIWNRQARPQNMREVDRELVHVLNGNRLHYATTGKYTVNYRIASNPLSVQADFFKNGNEKMKNLFRGSFPWAK